MKKLMISVSLLMLMGLTGCGKKQNVQISQPSSQKVKTIPKYQDPPTHSKLKGKPIPTKKDKSGHIISDPNRIMLKQNENDKEWEKALTK